MKLFNTLTRKVQDFKPINTNKVAMYSCGPTVYDHIHIGNLSSFIYSDTLRRVLQANQYSVTHVMNFTDVDDKTIRRSQEQFPDLSAEEALQQLTDKYSQLFLADMTSIGNNVSSFDFVKATDNINEMQALIRRLHKQGFAYIADDGVYFSITAYKKSGKKYGQLLDLKASSTSAARINNDEYDKESVHDFALWKAQKDKEPAWEFELDGHNILGRPGWHIECSAMSVKRLGQPFDIHTGGVDLIFPHHENEIAQSTAGQQNELANYFVHNEHLLVDGKKMSKSLNNFYTLDDVKEHGFEPLAFRLLTLQSHYRSQSNFTWENLAAAQNRLKSFINFAELKHNLVEAPKLEDDCFNIDEAGAYLADDLNTPMALTLIQATADELYARAVQLGGLPTDNQKDFETLLKQLDDLFSLNLSAVTSINKADKILIKEREAARQDKDWVKSDEVRKRLEAQGIGIRDTAQGPIWYSL